MIGEKSGGRSRGMKHPGSGLVRAGVESASQRMKEAVMALDRGSELPEEMQERIRRLYREITEVALEWNK